MSRVTADTNICISALNFGGMPERFLSLAEAGDIQLVTSDAVIAEVAKVLRLRQLSDFTERVQPTKTLDVITVDPSDNRILGCADAGEVDYIVSGDDHLLRLKQHGNAPIVKVAAFLKQLKFGEQQR